MKEKKMNVIIRQALAGRKVNFKLGDVELYPVAIIPGEYPYVMRDIDNNLLTFSRTGLFDKDDTEHGDPADALTYEVEPFRWGYYDAITLIDDKGHEISGYIIGDKTQGPDIYKTRSMSQYTHIAVYQDTTGYVSSIELDDDGDTGNSIMGFIRVF